MTSSVDDYGRREMKERERETLRRFASGDPDAGFWISWLETQGFCEYKLCLLHRGDMEPDTEAVSEGLPDHRGIKEAHDALALGEVPVEDAVTRAIGLGEVASYSESYVAGYGLVGQVDGLVLGHDGSGRDTAWLVDHKPRPRTVGMEPFYGQQRQVLGYAVAWSAMYPIYLVSGSIVAVIRDRGTLPKHDLCKGWLWEKALTVDDVRRILEVVDWVRDMLRSPGYELARDTSKAGKCKGCGYGHCVGSGVCDRDKSLE